MSRERVLGDCPKCGADMDTVGRAHRCRARPVTARNASPLPVTKPVTKTVTKMVTKLDPRGRPRLGAEPMTAGERMSRWRAKRKSQKGRVVVSSPNPHG